MNTQPDIKKILKKGYIADELELERSFILERKLRLLSKDNPEFLEDRKALRKLIKEYEAKNWSSDPEITDEKIKESDAAEATAEQERKFILNRKERIKQELAKRKLNQQDLGILLGHSKSYISELINGIAPFSTKDLIIIHHLFHIKLEDLIPTIISQKEKIRIKNTIVKINKPGLKLEKEGFML